MKIVCIFLFSACLYSCSDTPDGVIPREKMELVLFDYMSADVYSKEQLRDSTQEDTVVNLKLQQAVFKKYNISRAEFEKSFAYYSSDPERFKSLLDSSVGKHQRNDSAFINKGIVPIQGL